MNNQIIKLLTKKIKIENDSANAKTSKVLKVADRPLIPSVIMTVKSL